MPTSRPTPTSKPLEELAGQSRIPSATYRLQFNRQFTLAQAGGILDYLKELGISDCYASPLFQAGPQSTHGYDICCFEQINPHIGGAEGLEHFAARLRAHGLGLLLDMVPNHMGNDRSNPWWRDVLEKGRLSPFADFFDLDWRPPKSDLQDKVLVPTLGDHYGKVLENGELKLVYETGRFSVAYYDKRFPISPEAYVILLQELMALIPETDRTHEAVAQLGALAINLQPRRKRRRTELSELGHLQQQLDRWFHTAEILRAALNQLLAGYAPEKPEGIRKLHALLQTQHYRLAYWRVGPEEINYRRFFDVTELVSVRMELPAVFQATHKLIARMLQGGQLTGLRVDHPDGLWDPEQYFRRLQELQLLAHFGKTRGKKAVALKEASAGWLDDRARAKAASNAGPAGHAAPLPLYVVAEKILSGDEPLPANWLVAGTTGYDFLNVLNGLFVNRAHEAAFNRIYREFGGELDFATLVYHGKKRILEKSLISEHDALAHRLKGVALSTRLGLDYTFRQLHTGLGELIAAFPVYRTYITEQSTAPSPQDEHAIHTALETAKTRNPELEPGVLDFIASLLRLQWPDDLAPEGRQQARTFVLKFQQLTGPVMAKGLEDTAFYNFNRLVSLNEVGGSPEKFGVSLEDYHRYQAEKVAQWPHTLLATATHDTKRGEDVRARLNVLSEMPDEWRAAVQTWSRLNAEKKMRVNGTPAPHPNDEYLLYQTLVGIWPAASSESDPLETPPLAELRERLIAYMLKALKEAKARTTWTDPNIQYEQATETFIASLLDQNAGREFLRHLQPFARRVAFFGRINSLAQVLLKMTAPGVPDFYQGAELWNFSLVDPDNRRPVDYDVRRRLLGELKAELDARDANWAGALRRLLSQPHDGKVKLHVIHQTLRFRQSNRELFDNGDYLPLAAEGAHREHVCALARIHEGRRLIAVAPRLFFGLTGGKETLPLGAETWKDTWILVGGAGDGYRNLLANQRIMVSDNNGRSGLPLKDLLSDFPVALLVAE